MGALLTVLTGVAANIDDIITAAASQDELLLHLFSVFSQIQQYRFYVEAEKSEFFQDKIKYFNKNTLTKMVENQTQKILQQ